MTRIRRRLSAEEKTELWRRWRDGQSLNEIGRALGRAGLVVRQVVVLAGGFSKPTPYGATIAPNPTQPPDSRHSARRQAVRGTQLGRHSTDDRATSRSAGCRGPDDSVPYGNDRQIR